MNYDPNVARNMASQTVKLTFGMWDYRREMLVVVGGNTMGLSVIRCAVGSAFDSLPVDKYEAAYTTLTSGKNELLCTDEDGEGEDWLERMLIAAEITEIKPNK